MLYPPKSTSSEPSPPDEDPLDDPPDEDPLDELPDEDPDEPPEEEPLDDPPDDEPPLEDPLDDALPDDEVVPDPELLPASAPPSVRVAAVPPPLLPHPIRHPKTRPAHPFQAMGFIPGTLPATSARRAPQR
jgi:hypothetical protein